MSSPRKLLLLAYYFPPLGGAGTQRVSKFCKYLPAHGWAITVVTGGGQAGRWSPVDESLVADSGDGVRVLRVSERPGSGECHPVVDCHQGWCGEARRVALAEWRMGGYSAAMVTMSPFSLAHVGAALQHECDAPVMYDLRDPWTLDGWPTYRHVAEWWSHRRFMRQVLAGAAGVVANTPEAGRCIAQVVPGLSAERLCVIPNGYDAEDFAAGPAGPVDPKRFTVVHTGSLHSSVLYAPAGAYERLKRLVQFRPERLRPEGRTLRYLLDAIRLLRDRTPQLAESIRVVAVGSSDAATLRCVEESGVADQVEIVGYVPHSESVGWLMRADALFLPLHGLPPGARSRIVPGKAYEYLASGRPILACVPAGDARDLIAASGVGFLADPCDAHGISRRLSELVELWQADRLPYGVAPWVAEYERAALTARLSSFIESVVGTRAPAAVALPC